jgi:hypothetical protein
MKKLVIGSLLLASGVRLGDKPLALAAVRFVPAGS